MPDKKIEDYLHLYLGCEVQWWNNDGVYTLDADKLAEIYEDDLWKGTKPILRPLSDMSEEEFKTYNDYLFTTEFAIGDYTRTEHYAEMTRFLLSKHFDLFGLIEAGLAIDKTTIK